MTETAPEIIRPATLPETPTGWTRTLMMHLNFGGGKGSGTYHIQDEQGRRVEGILFGYNTGKGGGRGFILTLGPEHSGYLSWDELRTAYAAARAAGQ
jgi:hypothetical protein